MSIIIRTDGVEYSTFSVVMPRNQVEALEKIANTKPRVQVEGHRSFPCTRSYLIRVAVAEFIAKYGVTP